ncbi:transposase (plasmid) [Sinorhizobium numidicum]|uniref:Transposase n=1 Tax=Sinorhizobium numidicum TaxID=680248 RepID=A0ABY8D6Z8_9HYPH|nr:transposase [Sinorhizobium numidicum]WEX79299.1 transposase [Sinorhizobium numidicum]WEX85330.1 transposase [Sinorhizobium numidicum]
MEDRAQILAEAFAPGAVVSAVARRFEVSIGLIYTWRRQALVQEAEPAFVPAKLADPVSSDAVELPMAVEFPKGVEGENWLSSAVRAGGRDHELK